MRYMGSKRLIAKYIVPILEEARENDDTYIVDLFAGGFNLIDKVSGKRIANDIDLYVTSLFKALQNGWEPPEEVSRELYYDIKNNKDKYPKELVGFVGYGCSFGGRWFEGYARGGFSSKGVPRNHASESARSVMKQVNKLQGVEIYNLPYWEVPIPENSVIYCDPPYKNTKSYKSSKAFDHDKFWQWCRDKSLEGHKVFISEYNAPDDFECVWEKAKTSTITKGKGTPSVEKLFVYKGHTNDKK